jgi:WD40 repeat protein
MAVTPDGRQVVTLVTSLSDAAGGTPSRLTVFDLETRRSREITTHGNRLRAVALDPTGRNLVTQGINAALHVGPLTGEEPHLLAGAARMPPALDVSPDGKWVASGDMVDGSIRLSPMPDLSRPSLHALPLEELLAKLRTHTNLRVFPDPGAESGYHVEPGPFPGWANPPEW